MITKAYTIFCDRCSSWFQGLEDEGVRQLRATAKENGWKMTRDAAKRELAPRKMGGNK